MGVADSHCYKLLTITRLNFHEKNAVRNCSSTSESAEYTSGWQKRRRVSGSLFLSMKEKEPGYKDREHARGIVCVYKHTGAREVCLPTLKHHNLLLTCSPRLLMTPEYNCSQVLVQLSSETRDSSRL